MLLYLSITKKPSVSTMVKNFGNEDIRTVNLLGTRVVEGGQILSRKIKTSYNFIKPAKTLFAWFLVISLQCSFLAIVMNDDNISYFIVIHTVNYLTTIKNNIFTGPFSIDLRNRY